MIKAKKSKPEKILEKLANPNFNWSQDCSGLMSYDEWIVSRAKQALYELRKL